MVSAITVLRQDEPLWLDPERLAEIYVEMGEDRAQIVVSRATDDLTVALTRLRGYRRVGQGDALSRSAKRMATIAEPLGLSHLARVAQDVAAVALTGDDTALAATLARLERVAGRSLKIVTDLQDVSG